MRKASIRTKVILLFAALALLLLVSVGLAAYALNYQKLVAQYGDLASSAAELAATEVDGDTVARYLLDGQDVSDLDPVRCARAGEAIGDRFHLQAAAAALADLAELGCCPAARCAYAALLVRGR